MHDSSDSLIQQAVLGNAQALRDLLVDCGPEVHGKIAADIGSKWQNLLDADDVMQTTYMEAFLQIHALQTENRVGFLKWLTRIAENNLKDALKGLRRHKRQQPEGRITVPVGEDSYTALLGILGATSTTPSRHAARREGAQLVEEALNRLPADYRTAIRMYDLEGQPVDAVAAAMGRSLGAVHMLRARAHERLRRLLGPEVLFFTDTA